MAVAGAMLAVKVTGAPVAVTGDELERVVAVVRALTVWVMAVEVLGPSTASPL